MTRICTPSPQKADGPLRPFLPRGVRVENKNYLIAIPGDQTGMFLREGGAQRNRVGKARLMQGDHVHISFAEDQAALLRRFGKVEAKRLLFF